LSSLPDTAFVTFSGIKQDIVTGGDIVVSPGDTSIFLGAASRKGHHNCHTDQNDINKFFLQIVQIY